MICSSTISRFYRQQKNNSVKVKSRNGIDFKLLFETSESGILLHVTKYIGMKVSLIFGITYVIRYVTNLLYMKFERQKPKAITKKR